MSDDAPGPADEGAPDPAGPAGPHKRRPRYRGTHPRSFSERYKEQDPASYPAMQAHIRAQGRTPAGSHVPILVEEVLACLKPARGEVLADLTLGYGGHARALLARIGPTGRFVGLDHDEATLAATRARLEAEVRGPRMSFHAIHHAALCEVLASEALDGCDVVLADLGLSSMQIDDPTRGFSYRQDGPLDMRMDRRRKRSAAAWLATISESELAQALSANDEPRAERLAHDIVAARALAPIETTARLAEVVLAAKGWDLARWKAHVRAHPRETHPAARTFQALRLLVNDELAGLERLLRGLPWALRPGGRVASSPSTAARSAGSNVPSAKAFRPATTPRSRRMPCAPALPRWEPTPAPLRRAYAGPCALRRRGHPRRARWRDRTSAADRTFPGGCAVSC